MSGYRKLGKPTDQRKAMLRAMVTYLLENGKIETTVTRAKEVRAMAEKMITIAKQDVQAMLDAPEKKITFSSDYYGKALNYNGYQVSSFSSISAAGRS